MIELVAIAIARSLPDRQAGTAVLTLKRSTIHAAAGPDVGKAICGAMAAHVVWSRAPSGEPGGPLMMTNLVPVTGISFAALTLFGSGRELTVCKPCRRAAWELKEAIE